MADGKQRLRWVDLCRVVAVLAIVAFHLAYEITGDQDLRPLGFFGASLFFIVSGFVLSRRYPELSYFDVSWFAKRYARIASLYYPLLVALALLFGAQTYFRGFHDLILHLLFLNWISHDTAFSIISPAWFLVPLIALYAIFPFLNRFVRGMPAFLILAVMLSLVNRWLEPSLISFSPIFFLAEFCFGIAFSSGRGGISMLAPLLLGLINPVMALPFIVFWAFSSFVNVPLASAVTWLGNRTFEIFLFHESVIMTLFGKWSVFGLGTAPSMLILGVSLLLVMKIRDSRALFLG